MSEVTEYHEHSDPLLLAMIDKREREMSEVTEYHEHTGPLLRAMIEKLRPYRDRAAHDEPFFIHRVPPIIREGDPSAYEPQVVSIGPYHREDPKVQAMQHHKWRYMHDLLVGRPSYQTDQSQFTTVLEGCIEKVKQSEARARGYYSEGRVNLISSDDFVMMMVLDGCFILEFILALDQPYGTDEKDDPIHSTEWMFAFVWRDLLKLENQIPFFVLEDLFDIAAGPGVTTLSLKELAINYLRFGSLKALINPFVEKQKVVVYHLLHFYHQLLQPTSITNNGKASCSGSSPVKSIIGKMNGSFASCSQCILPARAEKSQPIVGNSSPVKSIIGKMNGSFASCSQCILPTRTKSSQPIVGYSSAAKSIIGKMNGSFASCSQCILPTRTKKSQLGKGPKNTIPRVVELLEAGIKLRRSKSEAKSCLDVTFEHGTLDIPPLCIEDDTNSIFRNLVAFEQCCPCVGDRVTIYTCFLDCVINNARDVTILQQHGIIENMVGSEEVVALLINQLGKEVTVDFSSHYLRGLFEGVNEHCGSKWPRHRARFVRDYCGNPWAGISAVAAAFLLLMTLAQVVLAVLSYVKQ